MNTQPPHNSFAAKNIVEGEPMKNHEFVTTPALQTTHTHTLKQAGQANAKKNMINGCGVASCLRINHFHESFSVKPPHTYTPHTPVLFSIYLH